jgi:hypothetical protein
MKAYNKIALVLLFAIPFIFSACIERVLQKSYAISLGDHTFNIPTEYLLDNENCKDGLQTFVIVTGKIPDLRPYENSKPCTHFPSRGSDEIEFNFTYAQGNTIPVDSLVRHWSANGQNYTLPKTWTKEGLVQLGVFPSATRKQNIYAFVRNGQPIAQLSCDTYADRTNPACAAYQSYDDRKMYFLVRFDIENLDWYAKEGLDKITAKVDSWRVK